jgi:predicted membrane-bound spermidine synthase
MHFDLAQVISLLVGVVLPLLTGLVTKTSTSAGFKAVLLLALSAVTAVLTDYLTALNAGTAFDLGTTLLTALGTFLVGVGMHFGIWKPTGVSIGLQRVGSGQRV